MLARLGLRAAMSEGTKDIAIRKQLPAELAAPTAKPLPDDIIKLIAMDIGKDTATYIEVMYPEAIKSTSSTFKISMRNHVYNDIMSIVELHDARAIRKRLADNAAHRKAWLKQWRKIRRAKP